jgi:hypothetical protein
VFHQALEPRAVDRRQLLAGARSAAEQKDQNRDVVD